MLAKEFQDLVEEGKQIGRLTVRRPLRCVFAESEAFGKVGTQFKERHVLERFVSQFRQVVRGEKQKFTLPIEDRLLQRALLVCHPFQCRDEHQDGRGGEEVIGFIRGNRYVGMMNRKVRGDECRFVVVAHEDAHLAVGDTLIFMKVSHEGMKMLQHRLAAHR